jgi:hypothetical protein
LWQTNINKSIVAENVSKGMQEYYGHNAISADLFVRPPEFIIQREQWDDMISRRIARF